MQSFCKSKCVEHDYYRENDILTFGPMHWKYWRILHCKSFFKNEKEIFKEYYLFGSIRIWTKCFNKNNILKTLFYIKDLDSHYVIYLFGIIFSFKHKCKFIYQEAKNVGINTKSARQKKLIISLTSYPARIKTAHVAINTLLQQSLKPDKIILWLAKEEFPNLENDLPQELLKLKSLGLEIEWCNNIKSYKKLVPTIIKYPDDIIVTADDDIYYQPNMLESLYNAYLKNPNCIYVKRSVKLHLKNGYPEGISSRKYFYNHLEEPSYFNQLMGGSGCLYPPHSLYKDCTNINIISETIPTHDDAYFWSMAILNKTKIQVIGGFNENLYFIEGTQGVGLIHTNQRGQSGVKLEDAYKIMIKKYPEILSVLNE